MNLPIYAHTGNSIDRESTTATTMQSKTTTALSKEPTSSDRFGSAQRNQDIVSHDYSSSTPLQASVDASSAARWCQELLQAKHYCRRPVVIVTAVTATAVTATAVTATVCLYDDGWTVIYWDWRVQSFVLLFVAACFYLRRFRWSRRALESILREPKGVWLTFDTPRREYQSIVTFSPYVTWKDANYHMTDEYRRNGWYTLEECMNGVRNTNHHALVAAPDTTPVVSIAREPKVKAPSCIPVREIPFPIVDAMDCEPTEEKEEVQPTPMDTTPVVSEVVVIPNISEGLSVWSCPPADTSLLDASMVALQATVARLNQPSPAPFVASSALRPKNPLLKDDCESPTEATPMDCEPILEEDSTINDQGGQKIVQPEPVSMEQQVSVAVCEAASSRKRRWEDAFGASDASSDLPVTEKETETSTVSTAINADEVDSDDDMEEIRATCAEHIAWYNRQRSHKEWNDYLLEHLSMTPAELVALYEEHHPQLKCNDDNSHLDDDKSKPMGDGDDDNDDDDDDDHADDDSFQHHNCIESAAQSDADEEDASLQDSRDEDEDNDSKTYDARNTEDSTNANDVPKTEDSTSAAAPVPLGSFYTCVPEYGSRVVRRSYRLRRSPVP